MPPRRKGGFFAQAARPEDDLARQREVAALMTQRRTVPQDIGVERIQPNPYQARKTFDNLDELAEAIRTHGFVSRLRVRPDPQRPGFFQLVYGERRLRAAIQAGLESVPCEVADHNDDELIEIGLIENIQRQDLDPLEEATAFQMLMHERGYSIRTLGEKIGKDKSYVEDRLALLRAPDDVQQMVKARPDSLRAAREIAKLPSPEQRHDLIERVTAGQINTHEVRAHVRKAVVSRDVTPAVEDHGMSTTHHTDEQQLQRMLAADQHVIQTILTRWLALLTQGDTERALVSEVLEETLRQAQQLAERLEP